MSLSSLAIKKPSYVTGHRKVRWSGMGGKQETKLTLTVRGPPKAWTTCIRLPGFHSMSCLCVEQLGWFLGLKTHCWDAGADQWGHHAHFQCQRTSNGMQTHGTRNGHQPTYPSKSVASWSGTARAVSHSHPYTGVHQTCIRQATTVMWCDAFLHAATFKVLLIASKCFIKMGRLVFILSKSHNMHQQLKQSVDNSLCQDNNHSALYMHIRAAYVLQILNKIFKKCYSTMVPSVTTLTLQRHACGICTG